MSALVLLGACSAALAVVGTDPAPVIVEFELAEKQTYVRQQVLATARLYVQPNVLSSSYSDPVAPGALVEQLGEPEISEVVRGGVSYQRIEYRYALFPLRAGELRVQAPVFKGGLSLRSGPALPFGGRLPTGAIRELRASSGPIRLQVLAPRSAQAAHWLPTKNLALVETLSPQTGPYVVGESLVRSIELQVEGQPHAQLPLLDSMFPEGLKVYADPPDGQSIESPRGLSAKQVWRWALVPTRDGEFELPAIQVRWWDVGSDKERVAHIAARHIQVNTAATAPADATQSDADASAEVTPIGIWPLATALAVLGWLLTAMAWWLSRRQSNRRVSARPQGEDELRAQQRRLQQALDRADAAGTRVALIAWASKRFSEAGISSLEAVAVAAGSERLALELTRLDRALYGGGTGWDAQALAGALDWGRSESQSPRERHRLRPLYPSGGQALMPEEPPKHSILGRLTFAAFALIALVAVAQLMIAPRMKSDAATFIPEDYRALILKQEETVMDFLRAFETIQDQVRPDLVPQQQRELSDRFGQRLATLSADLEPTVPPQELADFHTSWRRAVEQLAEAQRTFSEAGAAEFLKAFFDSRRAFVDAVYELYFLRAQLQRVPDYWTLPGTLTPQTQRHAHPGRLDVESLPTTGFVHREEGAGRSEYSLYVPENYDPRRRWPLILSLHGSHGTGRSSLLTWLRPAQSRGYLVLAPKSADESWSIENPEADATPVLAALAEVQRQYAVDARRIFVSGFSDGGTFSYALGLRCPQLWAGIAPIAGVLPPGWNLSGASGLPVLIVHGARDHVFPVESARAAYATLTDVGFEQLAYLELPEWGHGFPHAVHDGPVLNWLERTSRKTEGVCP